MTPQAIVTNYLLPLLIYGFVTGLANLLLSRRSQIELWAETHPRAAGFQKLMRAIGFDPWQVVSAVSLWATKKLPDAQRSDALKLMDPKPKDQPKIPPMFPGAGIFLLVVGLAFHSQACIRGVTPKTIDQAAIILCDTFFTAQRPALSFEDVEKAFCSTAEQIAPFLSSARVAAERGGAVRMHRSEQP